MRNLAARNESDDVATKGDVDAKADIGHKYHVFSNGQYFYDNYEQVNNLRLFTENANFSQTRFRPISDVEYFDGTAWVEWVGGDSTIKPLLDGRENTGASIDHTHRRFRFRLIKSSGWPTMALIYLQSTWSPIAYKTTTVSIEHTSDGGATWTLKETCVFGLGTTAGNYGVHMKASSVMHDGLTNIRVTIEIDDWIDSGSYTTIPLRRFEILSNYSGSGLVPWSWNYDKTVAFEGDVTSKGSALVTLSTAQTINGNKTFTGTNTFGGTVDVTGEFRLPITTKRSTLGSVAGDAVLTMQHLHVGGTNSFYRNLWMRRTAAGSDWITAELYDGISIDTSYGTPSTARTYWRRFPRNGVQAFGDQGVDRLTIDGSTITANGTLYEGANRVYSAANKPSAVDIGASPSGHTHSLSGLSDVTVTNPISGNVVRWSGTEWTNATLAISDISGLQTALDGKAASSHTHTKSQITDFAHTHAIGDLPVAASGVSSTTQVVRADDARLSNARTPTAHTHDDRYYTESEVDTKLADKAASDHVHTGSRRLVKFRDLPKPYFSAHRGGGKFIFPEGLMEGKKTMAAMGFVIDAADVRVAADGSLWDLHDDTVDRTTTQIGSISMKSAQFMKAAKIDADSWFNSLWTGDYHHCSIAEILDELGGKANMTMEVKVAAAAQPLADMIYERGIEDHVLVASSVLTNLYPARDVGCPTMLLVGDGVTDGTALAAGIEYVGVSAQTNTRANVVTLQNLGYKVVAYGIERRADMDNVGSDLDGYISEDPVYTRGHLTGVEEHRLSSDPYGNLTYYHGHIPYEGTVGPADRGIFQGSPGWFRNQTDGIGMSVLMGWACPTPNTIPTFEFDMKYTGGAAGTARWGGLVVGCPTDKGYAKANGVGYECFMRGNGNLEIWRRDGGSTATQIAVQTSPALANDTTVRVRINVTATQIIFKRLDTNATAQVTDSTYRGRFAHIFLDLNANQYFWVNNLTVS